MSKKLFLFFKLICILFLSKQSIFAATFTLMLQDNPPFTIVKNETQYSGTTFEIVNELFQKADLSYNFENVPLKRAMLLATKQNYSCVFPVQRAQVIEGSYQWVGPILLSRSALYSKANSKIIIHSLKDAKPYKIGALTGSGDAIYLSRFGFNVQVNTYQYRNYEKLISNEYDFIATEEEAQKYDQKEFKQESQIIKQVLVYRQSLGSLACNLNIPKLEIDKLKNTLYKMIDKNPNKIR